MALRNTIEVVTKLAEKKVIGDYAGEARPYGGLEGVLLLV